MVKYKTQIKFFRCGKVGDNLGWAAGIYFLGTTNGMIHENWSILTSLNSSVKDKVNRTKTRHRLGEDIFKKHVW